MCGVAAEALQQIQRECKMTSSVSLLETLVIAVAHRDPKHTCEILQQIGDELGTQALVESITSIRGKSAEFVNGLCLLTERRLIIRIPSHQWHEQSGSWREMN